MIGFSTDEIDGYSGFVFCTGEGKVYLPGMINRTIHAICADYNKEEAAKADAEIVTRFFCPTLAAIISGIRSAPASAKTKPI